MAIQSGRELIIVGDEAYTPQELAARERRRIRDKARHRRNYADPEFRKRWRAYQLEYQRRRRYPTGYVEVRAVGSLHDGRCTGPTKATGCRCEKVMVYDRADR